MSFRNVVNDEVKMGIESLKKKFLIGLKKQEVYLKKGRAQIIGTVYRAL